MSKDTIYRQVAIKAVVDLPNCYNGYSDTYDKSCIIGLLEELPPVEQKKGKWTEKKVIYKEEADEVIEEWQSCRCSECGRYDTRPYLYYFSKPRFCSWCGARMEGENESC